MACPHPESRKDKYRKEDKPNSRHVVWNFFKRTINITNYRNAKDEVTEFIDQTALNLFRDDTERLVEKAVRPPHPHRRSASRARSDSRTVFTMASAMIGRGGVGSGMTVSFGSVTALGKCGEQVLHRLWLIDSSVAKSHAIGVICGMVNWCRWTMALTAFSLKCWVKSAGSWRRCGANQRLRPWNAAKPC